MEDMGVYIEDSKTKQKKKVIIKIKQSYKSYLVNTFTIIINIKNTLNFRI